LAIAVTTSKLGITPTLIFDEVDSGVGGAVAHTVGRLLRQLGQDRQVLAVTHLPQVASCANHHWVVSKLRTGDQTFSQVTCIEGPEREQEIARMLGGESATQTSLAHAKEMLDMQNDRATAAETSKAKTSRPKSTDAAGPESSKSLPSKKPRPSKTA
jgi:DNA repair protein RecN (Recombination protein N)